MLAGEAALDCAALYRLTGGNPFYVTEVVQSGMAEVPASARDAVLARVSRLSLAARELLEAAALIGTRVEIPLLASVTAGLPSAADELLASGLLAGDGVAVAFRHEIVRMAVAGAIPPLRCGLTHARILGALRDRGCDDDARLAFHAEGAGDGPAVLRSPPPRHAGPPGWPRTGRPPPSSSGPSGSPGGWMPQPRPDSTTSWPQRRDWWTAGRRQPTLGSGRSRCGARPATGGARVPPCASCPGPCGGCAGSRVPCRGRSRRVAARTAGPELELAWAYVNLASRRMDEYQYEAAVGLTRQAQAIAESLGVPQVLSEALNTQGCALAGLGADWARPLEHALEIAVSEGLQEQAGRAFANLHSMYCGQLRFPDAEPYYADGTAYCDEHDIGTFGICLRGEHTCTLEMLGRWEESARLSLELLTRSGASPVNRINPLTSLGKILARRGEPGAWARLDEAMRSADGTTEPQHILRVRVARAEAYWLDGRPQKRGAKPSWPMMYPQARTTGSAA